MLPLLLAMSARHRAREGRSCQGYDPVRGGEQPSLVGCLEGLVGPLEGVNRTEGRQGHRHRGDATTFPREEGLDEPAALSPGRRAAVADGAVRGVASAPNMATKRDVLAHLTRDERLAVVDRFTLAVPDRRAKEGLVEAVAASKKATLAEILPGYARERLKELCRALGLDDGGKEKAPIVERIVGLSAPRPTGSGPARQVDNRSLSVAVRSGGGDVQGPIEIVPAGKLTIDSTRPSARWPRSSKSSSRPSPRSSTGSTRTRCSARCAS